jgi:hypothetical protein
LHGTAVAGNRNVHELSETRISFIAPHELGHALEGVARSPISYERLVKISHELMKKLLGLVAGRHGIDHHFVLVESHEPSLAELVGLNLRLAGVERLLENRPNLRILEPRFVVKA